MNTKKRISKLTYLYLAEIITPEQELELDGLRKSSPKNEKFFQETLERMIAFAERYIELSIKEGGEILQQVFKK
jgi:hypothetical protein